MKYLLVDLRNLTASLFSWLTMMWLLFYTIFKEYSIAVTTLWQLLILSFTWAIIFTFLYKSNVRKLKKMSMIKKFTLLITSCVLVESLLIYKFGLFGIASLTQWVLFIGIVFIIYAMSLGLFELYKRRASKEYTALLQEYQHNKRSDNTTCYAKK